MSTKWALMLYYFIGQATGHDGWSDEMTVPMG
jgi:hypothetical protein